MKTEMPTSLEIAQAATLKPILEHRRGGRARARGGRAVRPLQGEGRPVGAGAARRPGGREADQRHRDHADAGGRGQDDDLGVADAGPGRARPEAGALPARGVARPGLRRQGRRGRRRLRAGRPDGGPEPPLHRRPARDHGREQPAGRAHRRARPARERARARPARDLVAALPRHERPLAPRRRHLARRARERLPAPDRLRHHRRERDHGRGRRRPRPPRPAPPARRDHGRPDVRGRARHRGETSRPRARWP